jgi:hypothetical protein
MNSRRKLPKSESLIPEKNHWVDPMIGRLQHIARELEEIKQLITEIESRGRLQVKREELDKIEKRLNILEYELFYDSLN